MANLLEKSSIYRTRGFKKRALLRKKSLLVLEGLNFFPSLIALIFKGRKYLIVLNQWAFFFGFWNKLHPIINNAPEGPYINEILSILNSVKKSTKYFNVKKFFWRYNGKRGLKILARNQGSRILKRMLSLWTLKRVLSLRTLKRTLSLRTIKRTLSVTTLKGTLSQRTRKGPTTEDSKEDPVILENL